jgi:HK97 gp10 family phage protein
MARRSSSRRGGGSTRVSIEGIDDLRGRLEELGPTIIAAAKKAVRESAEEIKAEAKKNVAVDTGNLRDSVDIKYEDDGLRAEVGWRDRDDWYASLHEHGTRRIPANPVLGPATERERPKLPQRLTEEIRRALP